MTRSTWTVPVAPLLLLAALAASAAGADNAAKAAPGPPAAAADNAAKAAPGAPTPPVTWTVEEVTDIALKNHPLVKQADAETDAAVARKGQAESAWYPFVNLAAGYSRNRTFSPQTGLSDVFSNSFVRGDLNWMLYDFGRTSASVDRADANAAATRAGAETTREDVVFAAKLAFYNVLRAERTLSFQRENLRQRETLLRQATAFYEAGVRAKIDVARAEANVYDARAQVSQVENDLRVARITLLQRMGIDGPAGFALAGGLPELTLPGTMADWVSEAERNRPELRAQLEKERAATESLRRARSDYYPYLTGSVGAGYGADTFPLEQNYGAAVTLTLPIFSGFLTREQVKEASATISSAQYELTEVRRRVRLQVEASAYSVQEAQERLSARKKEREASEENLRLATARYEVGAGDIIEMVDAQTQMVRSDTDVINTAFDYAVSVASLLRAMGR